MINREFKICLIGCGGMTKSGHGPSVKKYAALPGNENVILAGCCDINENAAREAAENFGFKKYYTNYIEMVETEKPDVVMAITPVMLTEEISIELLKRKIPTILEKPPGMDKNAVMNIHKTAIENNVPARVAFNRRYTPLVAELKKEIEKIGSPVLNVNCLFIRKGRNDADFSTTASHGIDTARFLTDSDYKEATFRYVDTKVDGITVPNISISAFMENGATANLSFLPRGGCIVERFCVTLLEHTLILKIPVWDGSDVPGELICMHDDKVYKTVSGNELIDEYTIYEANGFYQESQSFFDLLRNGERPVSDVASGASTVEIMKCIRERITEYKK